MMLLPVLKPIAWLLMQILSTLKGEKLPSHQFRTVLVLMTIARLMQNTLQAAKKSRLKPVSLPGLDQ
jgi:hypothetical protein